MRDEYDLIVIGAGLIGLATARALLLRRPKTRLIVLEKETELARHQSGRNSGVIHAGLYYPAGSLKAELCREGRSELLRFAKEREIPFRITGKLVVALDEGELPRLDDLHRRGTANGLTGLRFLGRDEFREIEPHVVGVRALHVPETGVIDYRLVVRGYADEVQRLGGTVRLDSEVTRIGAAGGGHVVGTSSGDELWAHAIVACAGLQADRVAALSGTPARDHRIAPFRGDFFVLAPQAGALVKNLIYPVPDPSFPFLGVHFTRRIDGEVWAGPNAVPAFARERYGRFKLDLRDAGSLLGYPGLWRLGRRYLRTGAAEAWRDYVKSAAVREMRRYLPEISGRDVALGPSGNRAQVLARDGTLVDDFLLREEGKVLHVVNAPSPGATASLAIGARIAGTVADAID